MEKTGQIEIRIVGKKGNLEIVPDNYDIRDIIDVLKNAENLLFPDSKKERPTISYGIGSGSFIHYIKTTLQAVIGFNALLAQINSENYVIDFLESPTAKAFEFFQETARKQNVVFYISTTIPNSAVLTISRETKFIRSEDIWVDAELYFYGTIVDMGGKGSANVHIDTKELGLLKVDASKEMISNYSTNPLYKYYGLRATGRQNIVTAEIDKSSLKLLEIIDYKPKYDENYIQSLIKKAAKTWADVPDSDAWLQTVRGYD